MPDRSPAGNVSPDSPTDHQPLSPAEIDAAVEKGQQGIIDLLDALKAEGNIKEPAYNDTRANAPRLLEKWLRDPDIDRISPRAKEGIVRTIELGDFQTLMNAFARDVKFGTGGIREKMGFTRDDILILRDEGLLGPYLRGPNMINDLTLLLKSAGMAAFAKDRGFTKCVIGHDSRVQGDALARRLAQLFLAKGLTVFLFDEANMYPEVCYAVPTVKADFGLFISASHNDFRYNGYKVSSGNGSQFSEAERKEIFNVYMANAWFDSVELIELREAKPGQLIWLGGEPTAQTFAEQVGPIATISGMPRSKPTAGKDYRGHEDWILDIHTLHVEHCKRFLKRPQMLLDGAAAKLNIAYCAYHGAGRKAVPRLLRETGFGEPTRIRSMDALDGMFPMFKSNPGEEQQPDPGDFRAADIALDELSKQGDAWSSFDILIGTDPDSDRCGLTVNCQPEQAAAYDARIGDGRSRDYVLLPADEAWALLLHYQLSADAEANGGVVPEVDKEFVVLSHTTSDAITLIARKFGLGVIKTWVGFAMLAKAVDMAWSGQQLPELVEGRTGPDAPSCHPVLIEHFGMTPLPGTEARRTINVGAYEQSNGFSTLGAPPPDAHSLGEGGHARDKDGALAALLLAEVAAYAKQQNRSLLSWVDEVVYSDPDVGLFANYYEPDPLDGEYPGLRGDAHKQAMLMKAEDALGEAAQRAGTSDPLTLGGLPVTRVAKYLAGKYQAPVNWDGFPDEGLRFYFGTQGEPSLSHLTMRPSGTSNAMRFHVQLHRAVPEGGWQAAGGPHGLNEAKRELYSTARSIVSAFRTMIGADEFPQ